MHSLNSKDRYAIIFKLDGRYDALVIELNNEALARLNGFIEVAQAVNERHTEAHGYGSEDDDVKEVTTTTDESNLNASSENVISVSIENESNTQDNK